MRICLSLLLLTALAFAGPGDVQTTTLANGMKVLVQEDHTIPSVALYFFFRVGSRNEAPGTTGISHFFEHMMFNGAKKYGPKQFDREMEKSGGNNNAYTSRDVTVYTDWFPPTALELMFDMEADRIRDLSFDPKMIQSEREVVYSERRTSVDNSTRGTLFEQVDAAAFIAHPYHWPVVGWPSDIEGWTMDDLKHHFAMGYAPNNCVMVAVGDFSAERIFSLARRYLEPIPPHATFVEPRTKEPVQLGERRVMVHKEAQLPLLMAAYHVPESKSAEEPALEVLNAVLSRGQSSRLYRRLVDQDQLAIAVNTSNQHSLDPYLETIFVQPRAGVPMERVEAALYEEIDKLRQAAVSESELRKAKNQLLAAHYRGLETIAGRANALGTYEVFFGDYKRLFAEEPVIEAVTAEDVQKVAQKYLVETNRTVGILVPKGGPRSKGKRAEATR